MWLLFAFSGPVLWAASTHIDKYLVDKYFQNASTAVLMVFTAIINFLVLPVIWYFTPGIFALPFLAISVMLFSGMLFMAAMLFYLQAIQTEEVSVVVPLFQGSVLWSVLLAYLLLGETLTPLQFLGAALIILGALILSLNLSQRFRKIKLHLAITMLGCTFALALSSVIFKFFAVDGEFWQTTFWTYLGAAIFGITILFTGKRYQQFLRLFRQNPGAMFGINAANELINLGGSIGVRYALLLAPVSLVQAVSSTTSLFVFFFGVLLSLFFPKLGRENLSLRDLLQKGLAAVLVVSGILLINAI